jgi:cobalt-precorrin-6B (C15)-methyltransferase
MGLSGGPTQDEVMAISLFKSGLKAGDSFVDVGCGTGKVSIEASRLARRVYSIDRRSEAIACTRSAAERAGASNIEILEGEAVDLLMGIGHTDCAFVGGSRDLVRVLETLAGIVSGNIVVNAVKLETLNEAISSMRRLGIFKEAVSVQVCRSYDIAGGTMFRPIDPVYVIVGGKVKC